MIQLPTEFRTQLESYQGPLDLLLYLIKKDEVDILDIPVSRITEQYCTFLSILQQVDPNACGEFLVMAAHLMEIKSRSLLPTEPPLAGEESEDPRMELVRQLLEYKKYKERAKLLELRVEEYSRRFRRPEMGLPEGAPLEEESPLDLGQVSIWDLLTAFHKIELAIGARGPHRVLFEDRPLTDYITAIQEKGAAREGRRLRFEELFEECRDIYDAIGFFLAILEMAKRRLVLFEQEVPFGPIDITVLEETLEEPAESAPSMPATATATEAAADDSAARLEPPGDPATASDGTADPPA